MPADEVLVGGDTGVNAVPTGLGTAITPADDTQLHGLATARQYEEWTTAVALAGIATAGLGAGAELTIGDIETRQPLSVARPAGLERNQREVHLAQLGRHSALRQRSGRSLLKGFDGLDMAEASRGGETMVLRYARRHRRTAATIGRRR
jgi:hypothetical protein